MPVLEDLGGVVAGGGALGGDDDALTGSETVVLDHPGRSEPVERFVEVAGVSTTSLWAVRTPAAAMTSFANAFDPSMRAAAADGPKQGIPAARTASATPRTSGTSGPMTTRSAFCSVARATTLSAEARRRGTARRRSRYRGCRRGQHGGHAGVAGQGESKSMFTGTGADNEYAHAGQTTGPVSTRDRRGSACAGRLPHWADRRSAPIRVLRRRPVRGGGAGARDVG